MANTRDLRASTGMTVQRWFLLVLGMLAVFVAVTGVTSNLFLDRSSETVNVLVDRVQPAQTQAALLHAAFVDQETGIRGYALTGRPEFLEPFDRGTRAAQIAHSKLVDLTAHDPRLAADTRAVWDAGQNWRATWGDTITSTVRDRGRDSVSAATLAQSKQAFDGLRGTWDTQDQHLAAAQVASRADLTQVRRIRSFTFTAIPVALLAAAVAIGVILQITVVRPLTALSRSVTQVADGDFAHPIAAHGPSDVRDLSHRVETMRARIVSELDASSQQQEQLTRSNAELEQFAYVASHDLQEPLRKVISFCQMLERRYSDKLDDRGRQYVGFAVDGAQRMQILINDLLAFSRVGRSTEDFSRVDTAETVAQAVRNLDAAITETGAQVTVPDDLPVVEGSQALLVALWQNLIGNAVKFHRPDLPTRVTVGYALVAGAHTFSVTDDGIGIAPEYADKIFVIFQRLHNRGAYAGTGIGLAMCRKIVEYHGGRIHLDTTYTDGSRMVFTLPAGTG